MILKISVIIIAILLSWFIFDSAGKILGASFNICEMSYPSIGQPDCAPPSDETRFRVWAAYGVFQLLILAFVVWFIKRKPGKKLKR